MECSSGKRKDYPLNMDRLTSLPIELVHMILQLVPIRDAVRTSALSRTWRYRWMYIPHLVFDSRSIPPPTEGRKKSTPVDCVNSVLFLHNAEVFRFSITNFKDWVSPHIDRWLLVLGRKKVQEVILDFSNCRVYKLPSSLFSCQNLRVLKLKHCLLSLPPCAKGFCNLVELHLDEVIFTDETIASLILNNPLETLALHNCSGFTTVNIYAPNLCTFILRGPCERIHIGNTPILEYAELGLLPCDSQSSVLRSNIRRNLEDALGDAIHAVEIFASKHFIEILARCKLPERPSVSFYRMSCITLEINLENSKEVSVALCLFRGSPCLDELEIISCENTQVMRLDEERSSETQLHRKEDIFPILDTVELSEFKGTQAEMDFVSFVLLNAALLETMSLKWHVSCIHDNQRKALVLENMMQFKRASSDAQVLFVKPT